MGKQQTANKAKEPKTQTPEAENMAQEVETPTPADNIGVGEETAPNNNETEVETQTPAEEPDVQSTGKAKKGAKKSTLPDFLERYAKAYPAEKVFHVTSDRQVFLGKAYNLAKLHQNSLGKGEITTYNL